MPKRKRNPATQPSKLRSRSAPTRNLAIHVTDDEDRILGHRLMGDGGSYGFDAISEIGAALEQAATNQDSEKIRRYAGELSDYSDYVERVEVVYHE
jgi:hypothetical protein